MSVKPGQAQAVSFAIAVGGRLIVRDGGDSRMVVAIALIFLTLAPVAVAVLFTSRMASPTASDFGLVRPPLARATGLVTAVLVAVAAPLGEEFLFRGYFQRALSNWRGAWPAMGTTSVVFAAVHVGWTPIGFLLPVLVLGLGLCLLYHWTGSLYPALAMHALFNALSAGTVFEGWRLPVAMVFSVALTVAIARLIAMRLGDEAISGQ